MLGALLVGLINSGLTLMGLEFSQRQIVRGAIMILGVALARKGPGSRLADVADRGRNTCAAGRVSARRGEDSTKTGGTSWHGQ